MSFQAMAWAVNQKLPATKKIVLLMLANRVNSDSGKCVPKIKTLADDCGLSETATKSAIKELVDLGLIKVIPRFYDGQQLPNQYHLNTDGVGRQTTPVGPDKTQEGRQTTTESGKESVKESVIGVLQEKQTEKYFSDFWKAYPKKVGKDSALKAFAKRKPDAALLQLMLDALKKQKQSDQWLKDGGQFIPHPATWLNAGRWQDEEENGEMADDDYRNVGKFV